MRPTRQKLMKSNVGRVSCALNHSHVDVQERDLAPSSACTASAYRPFVLNWRAACSFASSRHPVFPDSFQSSSKVVAVLCMPRLLAPLLECLRRHINDMLVCLRHRNVIDLDRIKADRADPQTCRASRSRRWCSCSSNDAFSRASLQWTGGTLSPSSVGVPSCHLSHRGVFSFRFRPRRESASQLVPTLTCLSRAQNLSASRASRSPLVLPPAICSVAASFTSSRSALLSFLSSLSPAVGPLLFFWNLLISSLSRSRSALVFLVIVNHPSSQCLPRTACLHFNAPRCSGASPLRHAVTFHNTPRCLSAAVQIGARLSETISLPRVLRVVDARSSWYSMNRPPWRSMAPVSALLPQHVLLDEFHLLCTRDTRPTLRLPCARPRVATVACHTRASSATSRRGALSAPTLRLRVVERSLWLLCSVFDMRA